MGSLAAGPTWQCYVFWLSRLTRCADRWINRLCLWFCLNESFGLEDEGMNLFHVRVSCIFSPILSNLLCTSVVNCVWMLEICLLRVNQKESLTLGNGCVTKK